jgi:RsiW-degrading membrane proteinase PrsW (M82 family)
MTNPYAAPPRPGLPPSPGYRPMPGPTRQWSWVVVLAVGMGLFEAVRHVLIRTGNPNLIPSLILLGAAVIPASFVTFVSQRRLHYSVDLATVASVGLVGGVVGVVTAGSLEYDTLRRLGALPTIGVGLIEESAKLLAPLVVVFLTRHRAPADGLLIGVASGAGFAAMETMGYGFVTLVQSHGNLAAVDGVLLLRGVLSPAAHMAWTGLTAAALWHMAASRWHPRAIGGFVVVFLLAVALHATWDSIAATAGYAVLAAISLGLLTVTAHRLATEERLLAAHAAVSGRPPAPAYGRG